MRDEYNFFFNENGEFCCRIENESDIVYYKGEEAEDYLLSLNSMDFAHLSATSRIITLTNDDIIVNIEDVKKFYQEGYHIFLIKLWDVINKAIANKRKRHRVANLKVQGSRILVSGLLLALLGGTYGLVKGHSKDNDKQDLPEFNQSIESMLDELDSLENAYPETGNMQLDEFKSIPEEPINMPYLTVENSFDELDFNSSIQDFSTSIAYLDVEDKTDSEKYEHAYSNYYNRMHKNSERFGNPTNVMMGILTQESGGYVKENLMQIVFDSWLDQVITEYDYIDNCYKSIVLTDTPKKYSGRNIEVILRKDLKDEEKNLYVSCILFRYCIETMNHNISAAIQAYNQGCTGIKSVFAETSNHTGLSYEELLSDPTNLEFMNYTNTLPWGDPEYLYHVSWYLDTTEDITFKVIDENGEISEITTSFVRGSKSL